MVVDDSCAVGEFLEQLFESPEAPDDAAFVGVCELADVSEGFSFAPLVGDVDQLRLEGVEVDLVVDVELALVVDLEQLLGLVEEFLVRDAQDFVLEHELGLVCSRLVVDHAGHHSSDFARLQVVEEAGEDELGDHQLFAGADFTSDAALELHDVVFVGQADSAHDALHALEVVLEDHLVALLDPVAEELGLLFYGELFLVDFDLFGEVGVGELGLERSDLLVEVVDLLDDVGELWFLDLHLFDGVHYGDVCAELRVDFFQRLSDDEFVFWFDEVAGEDEDD